MCVSAAWLQTTTPAKQHSAPLLDQTSSSTFSFTNRKPRHRFVCSLLGRPIRIKLPPTPPPSAPAADTKARGAAERAAFGAYLSACTGDALQAVLAVLQGVADEANAAQRQPMDSADEADDPAAEAGGTAAAAAAAPPPVAVVFSSGEEVVMQCPLGLVLPLVERASQQLTEKLPGLLGLTGQTGPGGQPGGRGRGGEGGVGGAVVFPVRWWWGHTLDDSSATWHRQVV